MVLRSDLLFAPTRIYLEIVHYVKIVLQAPRNLSPFGASSDLTWEWKSLDIPSRRFLFTFAGASELFPFGASLDLRWNFTLGTSELILFGARSDRLWDLRFLEVPSRWFLLVSPVGFTLLICSWGTTFFSVGGLLFFSFLGEIHQSPNCRLPTFPSTQSSTMYIY